MRLLVGAVLALTVYGQDAREIVRNSLKRDEEQARLARQYTCVQRTEFREFDSDGRTKKTESKTRDLLYIDGSLYERLIAKNDLPLNPQEQEKERRKLEQNIAKRKAETPSERAKRLAEEEEEQEKQLAQMRQILDAFDLSIAGEEAVAGRAAWIIDATPRPGFKGQGRIASIFPKLKGRIWISKEDHQWVKAEAETLDTVSFGWLLARVQKGTVFNFDLVRVNDEVWLPKSITASGAARIALVKRMQGGLNVTFSNYKKYHSESRIMDVSEMPQN